MGRDQNVVPVINTSLEYDITIFQFRRQRRQKNLTQGRHSFNTCLPAGRFNTKHSQPEAAQPLAETLSTERRLIGI